MKKMLRTLCLVTVLMLCASLIPALAEEAQIVIGEAVYTIDAAKTSVIAPAAEGYGDGEDDADKDGWTK